MDKMTSKEAAQQSLHDLIRGELREKILSGFWPPGHRIPSELELSQHYDCSRMTVNKAVTELAKAGLIVRKRKAGSIVLPQRSQNAILQIHDVRDEVAGLGKDYGYALEDHALRTATPAERAGTDLSARQRVVALRCLHSADGVPFCLEERIINPQVVPMAATADFAHNSPAPWLLEHVPWSEAEHRIAAEPAGPDRAGALRIAPQSACLVVERWTWKRGEFVTHVRFTYPGESFALQARFAPHDDAGEGAEAAQG